MTTPILNLVFLYNVYNTVVVNTVRNHASFEIDIHV